MAKSSSIFPFPGPLRKQRPDCLMPHLLSSLAHGISKRFEQKRVVISAVSQFSKLLFVSACMSCFFVLAVKCAAEDHNEEIKRTFYPSDKIKTEAHYVNSKLDGVFKRYYENGTVWSEIHYRNGKREGVTKEYYLNGQLKADLVYEGGRLKSGKLYNMQGKEIMGGMTKAK